MAGCPVDDLVAINTALGHMIWSSGEAATMSTYDAFKGIVEDIIPAYSMNAVGPRPPVGSQSCQSVPHFVP